MASNFEESDSTLRFAQRAKNVVNRVRKNQIQSKDALITRYESMIQDLQKRLSSFKMGASEGSVPRGMDGHARVSSTSSNKSAPNVLKVNKVGAAPEAKVAEGTSPRVVQVKAARASLAKASPDVKAWLTAEGGHTEDDIVDRLAIESARNEKASRELADLKKMILGGGGKRSSDLIKALAYKVRGSDGGGGGGDSAGTFSTDRGETASSSGEGGYSSHASTEGSDLGSDASSRRRGRRGRNRRGSYTETATNKERASMKRIYEHTRRMSLLVVEDSPGENDDDDDNADEADEANEVAGDGNAEQIGEAKEAVETVSELGGSKTEAKPKDKARAKKRNTLLSASSLPLVPTKETEEALKLAHARSAVEEELRSVRSENARLIEELEQTKRSKKKMQGDLVDRDRKMKEATSALRVTLMSAKKAMRDQQRLQDAVRAQEASHVRAIHRIQEEQRATKQQNRELQAQLDKADGATREELNDLRRQVEKHRENHGEAVQSLKSESARVEEHANENASLRAELARVGREREKQAEALRELHKTHTSETQRLETTLTAVRGELANAASTYDSKIERLEATCTSLEHEKKEAADEHADAVARVSATLTRQAEEAAAKVAKERAAEVARLVDRYDTSSRKWEANTKSLQDEYEHRLAYVVV